MFFKTEEEKERWINEFAASKMTLCDFANIHNLKEKELRKWISEKMNRFKKMNPPTAKNNQKIEATDFVEVSVNPGIHAEECEKAINEFNIFDDEQQEEVPSTEELAALALSFEEKPSKRKYRKNSVRAENTTEKVQINESCSDEERYFIVKFARFSMQLPLTADEATLSKILKAGSL